MIPAIVAALLAACSPAADQPATPTNNAPVRRIIAAAPTSAAPSPTALPPEVQQAIARGQAAFRSFGCVNCHRMAGGGAGPSLKWVYGSPVKLESGAIIRADDAYIRESILAPEARIVAGYAPIMPSYPHQISQDDLVALIAYIRSIGGSGAANLPPAQAGERLFYSLSCVNCHRMDGTGKGPSLAGVFGSQVKLRDGTLVNANPAYIYVSMITPDAQVVAGYEPIMPSYVLSGDQLAALTAYIRSLAIQPNGQ